MSRNLTTPVGRLVGGSLYLLTDNKDDKGQVKVGTNGQPQQSCWFHVAIPKGTERHWAETPWGRQIWEEGHKGHPSYAPHPSFAWKIEDGDDTTPQIKRQGRKNSDNENLKNCWLLKFSSSFLPKIFNKDGTQTITEPDAVKLGYYVQVNLDVACNTGASPGVYLNPRMVALSAYGPEINYGMDPAAAGFGAAPLPAGASAVPPAGFTPAPPGPVVAPGAPPSGFPIPGSHAPTAGVPGYASAMTSPSSPVAPVVTPAPDFLTPGAVATPPVPGVALPPNPPAPVPAAPAVPKHIMTAAAQGVTYEAYIAAGWTDKQLVDNKLMVDNIPY